MRPLLAQLPALLIAAIASGTVATTPAPAGSDDPAQPVPANRSISTGERFDRGFSCLAFSPDGTLLATGGRGTAVRLWEVETGKLRAELEFEAARGDNLFSDYTRHLAFSPDGRTLVAASESAAIEVPGPQPASLDAWEIPSGRHLATVEHVAYSIHSLRFSGDGRTLHLVGRLRQGEMHLSYETARWKPRAERPASGFSGRYSSVHETPDGRYLAVTGVGVVRAVDVVSRKEYIVASDEEVRVLDAESRKELATLGIDLRFLAFSPDGSVLALGRPSGRGVEVWPWSERGRGPILADGGRPIAAAALSREGRWLAAAGLDGTIVMWDMERMRNP
jgi:WD40 repeat protein